MRGLQTMLFVVKWRKIELGASAMNTKWFATTEYFYFSRFYRKFMNFAAEKNG